MTWGQYCFPAGVVSGIVVTVMGFSLIMEYRLANDAVAILLAVVAFAVGGIVSSLQYLDRRYIAQERQKEINARAEADYEHRLHELAAQLYETHLETAPNREMIAYMKDRATPSRFIEAAREQLKSGPKTK